MTIGSVIGVMGIAVCVLLCGIGSALGLYKTGSSAAGVLGENPKKFGKYSFSCFCPQRRVFTALLSAL